MAAVATIKPISQSLMTVQIVGISPMVQHKWSAKAIKMITDKHAGIRTKNRDVRDPEQEFRDAAYVCEDGSFGFPSGGIKKCLINAAHKDMGLEKTLLRKSLFVRADDTVNNLLSLTTTDPVMRMDIVRVGAGSTDLRYRPEFREWSILLNLEIDADALTSDAVVSLIDRAGFGVGLGEMRPEKDGENGRFRVDTSYAVTVVPIDTRLAA